MVYRCRLVNLAWDSYIKAADGKFYTPAAQQNVGLTCFCSSKLHTYIASGNAAGRLLQSKQETERARKRERARARAKEKEKERASESVHTHSISLARSLAPSNARSHGALRICAHRMPAILYVYIHRCMYT